MSQLQLFAQNTKLTAAVTIINDIAQARFPLLLTRVIKKLDAKNEKIFTPQEEAQLQDVLKLSPTDLTNVLEAITYIFEQSAYYSISPTTFVNQLEKTGLDSPHIEAFQRVWQEEAEALISKLRTKSVSPYTLDSVGWRLHLHMSQSTLSRVKTPVAIFKLGLNGAAPEDTQSLTLEFGKDELKSLYLQLETIQEQLDTMT